MIFAEDEISVFSDFEKTCKVFEKFEEMHQKN